MDVNPILLLSSDLFVNFSDRELSALCACGWIQKRSFPAGCTLFFEQDSATEIGVLLSGRLHVVQTDFYGHENLIAVLEEGDLFGETAACSKEKRFPFSVRAQTAAEALMLPVSRIASPCQKACAFHGKLIANLLSAIANKNLVLAEKLEIVTARSTQDKILAYLNREAKRAKSPRFTVSLSREQLARYLSVDRSAMCTALSKLAQRGIIAYAKDRFEILNRDMPRD